MWNGFSPSCSKGRLMSLLLILLSGLLLGASLPPNTLGPLEWVALAPVFLLARRARPLAAFLAGVGVVLIAASTLILPLKTPEEWGNAGGGCLMFALLIGWACAWAASSRTASPWRWTVLVAASGVLGELLVQWLFPVYVAMGQWRNPMILPVASVTGAWGVSFLLYAFNAALALAWLRFTDRERSPGRLQDQPEARWLAACLLSLALLHGWGAWKESRPIAGKALRVAAIQPGSEESLPLLREAKARGAQVVVGPELALSEPLERDLKRQWVPGLYQVIGYESATPATGLPENLASVVTPEGRLLGRYSKMHPFGTEREVHQPGKKADSVMTPLGRFGLAICYDTMFTDTLRLLTRHGAQAVFVPNLDPLSSRGALHAFHAAATVLRAAENGVPVVRSEWNGYSMIVEGGGRIVSEVGMKTPAIVTGTVHLPDSPGTLYTRAGDVFPPLCILALVLLVVLEVREDRLQARPQLTETTGGEPGPSPPAESGPR